jgi:acyl-coenzyme A thioesterase PaaI-like protein
MTATTPAQWLAFGREKLDQQAFSRLLGAEWTALTAGQAQLELPWCPDLLQPHGFAHAGVVSVLAERRPAEMVCRGAGHPRGHG